MDLATQQLKIEQDVGHENLHPIFTKDPAEWIKLVSCQVQISTEDGQSHTGYVYTVDPVSESIVLINSVKGSIEVASNISLKLLVGASIRNINIISEATDAVQQSFNRLFRPEVDETLNEDVMNSRKLKLKSWLEKNRLPVTVGGDKEQYLTVAGALTIQPPYTEDSCLSTNEIILSRIQGLIKNMPSDIS